MESSQPTETELAILQVLWDAGALTVRQVHERLGRDETTRYTTTLKQLQVMDEKGLVKRDCSSRSHVYMAAIDQDKTTRSLVRGFIDRVLGGSTEKMVLHALESGDVEAEEIAEIKRLVNRWGKKR